MQYHGFAAALGCKINGLIGDVEELLLVAANMRIRLEAGGKTFVRLGGGSKACPSAKTEIP